MAATELTNEFNVDTTTLAMSNIISALQTNLDAKLTALDNDPSSASALANFQAAMNEWSVSVGLATTIQRTLKESMSSIVQKM